MVPLRLSATPLWTQSSFSAALVDQNLLSIYPFKTQQLPRFSPHRFSLPRQRAAVTRALVPFRSEMVENVEEKLRHDF